VAVNEHDFGELRQRLGDDYLGRRMRAQVDLSIQFSGIGLGGRHFENLDVLVWTIDKVLRVTRLYGLGRRNALATVVRRRRVLVPSLPEAFRGLRLLQLSDLHLDGYPGFGRSIAEKLAGVEFDACVLTGDFRFLDVGRYAHITDELDVLLPALRCRCGIFGILGNHDFIEMVPLLEARGIRMLVNEAAPLAVDGDRLWLVGLDDAHFYGLHDFDRALRGVPPEETKVLLVHSPEVGEEASRRGFGLYLSGHTHAGQMCLPGGRPLMLDARCPREREAGAWRVGDMPGYTSAGVGCSGVFARFFCPPEIVIHELAAAGSD
jgi:uncharacterized protein